MKKTFCRIILFVICFIGWSVTSYGQDGQDAASQKSRKVQHLLRLERLEKEFNKVRIDMTRYEVIKLLGKPHQERIEILPEPPFWGPQESLVNIIKPGSEYEEWQYTTEDNEYWVFFGSREGAPRNEWRVLDKGVYPKDAAF